MAYLCSSNSRNGFVRGVYLLLSMQFTIIMLSSLFALLNRDLRNSLQNNIEVFVMMSVSLLIMVAIGACFSLHRQTPWNASMLGVFTVGYCLLMATVSAASESYGAVFVFGTLAIICLLITLVSCVENWNPLSWVSIFILLLLVLAFYIVAFGFVRESPEITSVSFALSLVVTFYLLIDTSSVMTRPNLQLESDEVVFAVLTLHLDGLIIISKEVATKCYCI